MAKASFLDGWTVGERIGRGGNSNVYGATQDGKTVALKILRRLSPKARARFCDEVAAMNREES